MAIRFLEYLKFDNKVISLYVVQDNDQAKALSFKINIRDGRELVTISLEMGDNAWKVIPPDFPEWIREIQPLLIEQIELRCEREPRINVLNQTD